MPTVGRHYGRRGMVSGHHEHVRVEFANPGNQGIKLFQCPHLGVKIAVFPGGVGRFVVNEEEVVVLEFLVQGIHFIAEGVAGGNYSHVGYGGQAAVHGVGGDCAGVDAVHVAHGRQGGQLRPTPKQHHVAPFLFRQQFCCLGDKPIDQI